MLRVAEDPPGLRVALGRLVRLRRALPWLVPFRGPSFHRIASHPVAEDHVMAPPKPTETKRRYFSVEEANKTLPLVRAIVSDIVRQFNVVNDLKQRLSAVMSERKRPSSDPYSEELAQSQAEMESEEAKLAAYINELTKLGVELKGTDGLCDFYSIMDGREVYLCWRLGEPEVMHWHELNAGAAGRKPLAPLAGSGAGRRPH